MFKTFITLHVGWKTYRGYDVAYAGIALSCLYMTVLGFDNITVGYAYLQGINESLIGILMAVGAVTGLLGTIVYPIIRKRLGLERSGFVGLFAEIFTLCACVVSVWAPGSPFDPFYLSRSRDGNITMTTDHLNHSDIGVNGFTAETVMIQTQTDMSVVTIEAESYLSIGLLLGGIVTARFGLWLTDLTISQLFLENVKETERGIVNGVQNALNQLMDMFKFLLVILIPQPEFFGFLILTSFGFICLGLIFYARYSYSARGHLFHFDKLYNY
ncbi:hypothetical protein KUTeg_008090 [Tegillarca granosa]|uniref:Solute carrier family 40 member n=1 Tax=Tegillarca granosa TaxID=220873 RepID=A0ABQ9F863_TEGGR|nr:hypothetical protein KUTeg_008090 [Tegillarca granosa]